jgi:hypothetical protein
LPFSSLPPSLSHCQFHYFVDSRFSSDQVQFSWVLRCDQTYIKNKIQTLERVHFKIAAAKKTYFFLITSNAYKNIFKDNFYSKSVSANRRLILFSNRATPFKLKVNKKTCFPFKVHQ